MKTPNMSETQNQPAHEKPLLATFPATSCETTIGRKLKIAFFGHFGKGNYGNESTLQAMLCCLRRLAPTAEFSCICTGPDTVAATYNVAAVPSRIFLARRWTPQWPAARLVRRFLVAILSEPYQWLHSFRTLRGTDALVVPGTGLLNDINGLLTWGPYDMFRWSVAARLCRSKLLFVSVGAGPLDSRAGRFLVRAALCLADFRSYREESTAHYLEGIGFEARNDPVYPDLAFSLPASMMPLDHEGTGRRPVIGLGLMKGPWDNSADEPASTGYSAYLESLVEFAGWLLANDYDVRLLIGDVVDAPLTREFRSLLQKRSVMYEEERLIDEPIQSVDDLLKQLAATDLVVATRFHNVLLALLLEKPVIAISFHHKCTSLMSQMGLSEYCQDVDRLSSGGLIEQFSQLRLSDGSVSQTIRERVEACRKALEDQYAIIFGEICSNRRQ
jgi:polysaccharide pyruvyl transferase WcaK-like protein